ncbi:dihydrolipoyl dehydrogenase family protein [Anaerosinus massiliensis]|uniref:dihydrolipoyl dehydrogenase family protein n=1 Tax=Massilibacillus massiliensis TaxID=1806837 RepID=UPI000A476082|nr:dihydrolipoyl dehydrogenase [Massilibacillus massiliensis]
MKKYDVIVIGSGSGNIILDAALKQGLKCAQIEKGRFGGTCLTRGCIPTKVMVTAADYLREMDKFEKIGVTTASASINWETVSRRVWKKINESNDILDYYQAAEDLDVYQGTGYFIKEKVLQIACNDGTVSEEITADKIFIAVGAHTNIPQIDGLESAGYITSESLFGEKYPKTPYKSLVILGGGPIGTEFAHIFSAAGTKVTIVQRNIRLLVKEDDEISAQIEKHMRKLGVDIILNHTLASARVENGEKILTFVDKTTKAPTEIRAEEIMLAAGIQPATNLLHLENTAIETDERGFIRTNEFLETSVENVWAFGDVNGKAPFRHKANYEAEILAHNLFDHQKPEDWRWARYDVIPAVTFTYPQVAHIGLTESQAIKQGYSIHTAKHHYSSTAKGFAMGFDPGDEDDGFVKVIVNKNTNTILGMHIIGPHASILLQPFINLMNAGKTILTPTNEDIASATVKRLRATKLTRTLNPNSIISITETMTPHPSLSEVVMWIQYYLERE